MLLVDTGQTSVPYALGEVKKRVHNDDHLLIQTSNVGTIELKLLPVAQDSIIICVIRTVCAQACDSRIDFYTTGWEKIDDSTLLPPINREIFFDSSQKERENYKYAVSLPGIYPVSAKFSENGTDLLLAFDFKEYLDEQQIAEVQLFLKSDTIVLKWDRVSFKE